MTSQRDLRQHASGHPAGNKTPGSPASSASGFVVRGTDQAGISHEEKRGLAGSAAVLAMKWMEGGYADVRLHDGSGRDFDLLAFRHEFLGLKT